MARRRAAQGTEHMGNFGTSRKKNSKRGIVLTLDISIAMMILLVSIAAAYATYGTPSRAGFDIQILRNYLQDSATLMSDFGYLSDAADVANGSDASGIREVMRATPSSICMQVTGYGTVLGQDLIGYWKFDEGSGTVASDSSGNGYTGAISSTGASFSPMGKNGQALLFNGSGYVESTSFSALSGLNQYTESAWIKFNSLPSTYPAIITRNGGWDGALFIVQSGSKAGSQTGANWTAGATTLQPNTWYHIAASYNSQNVSLYVNGNLDGTYNYSSVLSSTPILRIGALTSGTYNFNGTIDEVRIYSRALTASEIQLLYSDPSNILFVVDKPECAFSGGEMQTLTVPFVLNADQESNEYYYATMRAWIAGANK